MPYSRSLQEFCLPEFYAKAPDSWERRLREISPITDQLAHLVFRKFESRPDWRESMYNLHPERPIWAVYSATPRARLSVERAEQFRLHWSELPKAQQPGRKALVSNYQHFMYHTSGVDVRPLWIIQGEHGGTPAHYSPREQRYLDAVGAVPDPFPVGTFAGATFNELTVTQLLKRDRLVQACNRFDELEKMDRPEALKAEDEAAERVFRETYLDTIAEQMAPNVEFMKSSQGRKLMDEDLPPAPKGLANTLATWKDVWKETGVMPGVQHAPHQKVFATS